MYTEDDEKVKVKKDNSNNDYSDLYTSFTEIDEKESSKKEKKKDKIKKEVVKPKEEKDYSDFYTYDDAYEKEYTTDNKGKKNILKVIIGIIIFILVIAIIVILVAVFSKKVTGDIELAKTDISLDIGGKEYISYKVVDTESAVNPTFESSNTDIAIVSENGQIIALSTGEATITIRYTIDGVAKEKKCHVKVSTNGSINTNVVVNVSGVSDGWTNQDAVIKVDASSIFGITKIEYAINCDSDCSYQAVSNNQIVISSTGTTNVKIKAQDKKDQETIKDVVVKIDKDAPSVTLNSDKNIVSNKNVTVCANCSDSGSGCKQNRVCKTYSSTQKNQVITVEDNAGNKKNSDSFNVTITAVKEPCTLSVSSDGVVTATLRETATYYGFNSNYTGKNTLSQKITINASKKGESGAKVIYYYVKNKNGTGGKCFITVIKTCNCTNKNSTSANCPVTCTFTSK